MSKYEFIDSQKAEPGNLNSVVKMCRWLAVSTSGFYHWATRPQSATAARRQGLTARVQHFFEESEGTYGYRRIHAELLRRGVQVGDELVRDLMRESGLVTVQPRPYRTTTVRGANEPDVPDLVRRDFTADRPGTKLVGDITYISTWQGWLYLATVIDCFNKEVVGYALADHMRTELVTDALTNAPLRPRSRRLYLAFRPGHPIHLDRFQGPGGEPGHALLDRTHRGVLGQQHRRIVLRVPEERTGVPNRLRDQITSPERRHSLHRGVLQQQAPSLRTRLPAAQRSPLWLSTASPGSVEESTNSAVRNHRSSSHQHRVHRFSGPGRGHPPRDRAACHLRQLCDP